MTSFLCSTMGTAGGVKSIASAWSVAIFSSAHASQTEPAGVPSGSWVPQRAQAGGGSSGGTPIDTEPAKRAASFCRAAVSQSGLRRDGREDDAEAVIVIAAFQRKAE